MSENKMRINRSLSIKGEISFYRNNNELLKFSTFSKLKFRDSFIKSCLKNTEKLREKYTKDIYYFIIRLNEED